MLRLSGFSCVFGGAMALGDLLSSVGLRVMYERLRVWLYVFGGWQFGHVVRLVF